MTDKFKLVPACLLFVTMPYFCVLGDRLINKREIRSFVLRQGRMTANQQWALENLMPIHGVEYVKKPVDFNTVFNNDNPVILEIGFGMGQSLLQNAVKNPEVNYLGIEVHKPGVGRLLSDIHQEKITNLKLINHDAVDVLTQCVKPNSLYGVQIFFPDPWHKKRHHKRRLIQPDFIELVVQKLILGGFIHCATDWEDYAQQMMSNFSENNCLRNKAGAHNYSPRPDSRPKTKFEERGLRLGHGVWDMIFTKTA